ncbi:MAG TPA: glycosyl hydrolase family 65 protein [Candidatus Limnocylindrales bacterium]|nr:glycosyl hydrolase family 65 protein [Candidatus Limnocylindrales bacterium]
MSNLWRVHTNKFVNERESIMRNGNVYQIANGYMGYRGTLDEFGPDELVGITLAGIYDRVGDAWREPVNAPNGGFTQVALDGAEISALSTGIKKHRQSLNLGNAVFERETEFKSKRKILKIKSTRFLSADQPNSGVIRYSLTVDQAARIRIRTGIDYNIWDLNGPHLLKLTPKKQDGILLVQGVTNETGKRVAVAEAVGLDFGKETHATNGKKNLRVITLNAEAGQTYTFCKYFAVFTENDPVTKPVSEAAISCVRQARALGYEVCLNQHNAQWAKKWEHCDVKIEGDDEAQQALRYSIFQLLIVAPVNGSANSIPARALSGQVYKGAIFWDTEMFMFPFFLYTCPEKAVELMRYRIKTLDGARRKAKTEGAGYRGAFYAWESQESGDDACTYFNIGDPFTKRDLRTHFRDKQVHISGDVAIAMWEYFKITGDDSLLLEGGAEVILECARFYYSYAYFKKDKNRYEILDVIGPDEYHERVNNNAFTSMVAKATFEIANAAVNYLKQRYPGQFKVLVKKMDIARELPLFVEAAGLLYVPQPDEKTGVIEQFDAYYKLKETTIEALKARMMHPHEYLGAGQGLAVPTKIIKQADVVMMLNLFTDRYSDKIKKANWEYYEPRTEHGSSLSACAYAMVAADIGKLDRAYNYFLKTAKIDIEAESKTYVGTIFIGGSHPAANGGAWMTAVFGFGGVKANAKQVAINPKLYKKWKSLHFNLAHQGDRFSIKITPKDVTVAADALNKSDHAFIVAGQSIVCTPGKLSFVKYHE